MFYKADLHMHSTASDGQYTPAELAMSLNDMRYIAGVASKPLDVHLMIEHPGNNIRLFLKSLRPGDTVYIHPEASPASPGAEAL